MQETVVAVAWRCPECRHLFMAQGNPWDALEEVLAARDEHAEGCPWPWGSGW